MTIQQKCAERIYEILPELKELSFGCEAKYRTLSEIVRENVGLIYQNNTHENLITGEPLLTAKGAEMEKILLHSQIALIEGMIEMIEKHNFGNPDNRWQSMVTNIQDQLSIIKENK